MTTHPAGTDRLHRTPMAWRRVRDGGTLYHVTATVFEEGRRQRRIDWVIYRSGSGPGFTIGVSVRGEALLHTVVGYAYRLRTAKRVVKETAFNLLHAWGEA